MLHQAMQTMMKARIDFRPKIRCDGLKRPYAKNSEKKEMKPKCIMKALMGSIKIFIQRE